FIRPLLYRPDVACLLYKKEDGRINSVELSGAAKSSRGVKVLLAERRHPLGHWQLPQGGTDGEDLITAGTRELREEIGTRKFKPVACFKNLYKYEFGATPSRGVKAKQIEGYKGQKQGLFIAEFIGQDEDITINFWDHRAWRWVDLDKVADEVHKYRREATKIFIDKFKSIL
ncbi:MAG: NUDIX domain-containing protein, partial [Patescibacteria group bacterium]